ncbi:MAG: hypothetical protein P8R42_04955 [Candidatus Binatia bacterium]|nr:hypothetical protein [Candidatus Binatia bacterium]
MNDSDYEPNRPEVLLRATRIRAQFPRAPLHYFAHSLAYELDMKPGHILQILNVTWGIRGQGVPPAS